VNAAWAQLPALQVVVPLVGAVLVAFLRSGRAAYGLTLLISLAMPVVSALLLWQTMHGGAISYHLGGWEPPWGIEYRIDVFNGLVLMMVSTAGAVIMPFAWRSVAAEIDEDKQAWFYCMFLLCMTGLLGIAVTGDAFNAFVFLEVSSLSSYVLIALGRDRRALVAALQYLIMGTIGATFYVIGIGLIYVLTGTLNIADISVRLQAIAPEQVHAVVVALAFITVGLGLKLALFPLHVWLPNAYAYAPSMVSTFLAATATKVAVYLLVRFAYSVFGLTVDLGTLPAGTIVLVLSVAAMFVAAFVAIFETDLKRMLAYSSVSQIGYITLGIGLVNKAGLTGAIVHLVNHAMMKGALFLALGAVMFRINTNTLNDLAGIGRRMPWTMTAFTIAGFALIGTPGTVGFISKWYLVIGALDHGYWWLAFLIVGSSLLALVYVGRVVEVIWFRDTGPLAAQASDPPPSMLLPTLLLAAAVVYFGIDTRLTAGIAEQAAAQLIGGLR
jgi:multicomponent Na+:H+ antiporter subunit D